VNDDDQLFIRCLIVAATLTGCAVSALGLALPPALQEGSQDGVEDAHRGRVVHRASVTFTLPSQGFHARLSAALTAQRPDGASTPGAVPDPAVGPSPARRPPPARPNPRAASMAMTLQPRVPAPSGAAVEAVVMTVGDDAASPRAGRPLTTRPLTSLWPQEAAPAMPPLPDLADMEAVEINVRRLRLDTADGSLATQGTATDPLPEFRRFLPRAQACATSLGRRSGQPLSGKVILGFTVAPTGWVTRARVVGGSLTDPDARACLADALQREHFFPARDGDLDAERVVLFAH
jgi:hypothetical protein